MKKLVIALLVLAALSVGGVFVFFESSINAEGAEGPELEFEVAKGSNARSVGAQLEKLGLVPSTTVWRYAIWKRGGLQLKAGKFKVSPKLSPLEVAAALEKPPLAEDEPFVVVEGWRIRDVDEALAQAGRIDAGSYVKAASSGDGYTADFPLPKGSLEGFLYPETYELPKGRFDPRLLVQKQLDLFSQRIYAPLKADVTASPRSLTDLVIMASMLEREEPLPKNRKTVAGILWKRIDKGYPLGVDATSRYELKSWNDRSAFLVKLRDSSDPYNSRLNKGLPPTAIGACTLSSFEAALKPEDNEFMYYLHDAQKQLHPSRNAAEHEELRKKFNVY